LYRSLPKASVTCLDYSADMMENARKRAEEMKLNNVSFVQGDVGVLPFADESFDLVLSLNGFHAFPDKDAAFRETFRVLKPGGIFCGCFYIAGEFRRTDRFVRRVYEPKGFFTPPFETKESLTARLRAMYAEVNVSAVQHTRDRLRHAGSAGTRPARKGFRPCSCEASRRAERSARKRDIAFMKQVFPDTVFVELAGQDHAEFFTLHPEEFCDRLETFIHSSDRP